MTDILICGVHVPKDSEPEEAAKVIGNIWCDSPTKVIDAWGDLWFDEIFIKGFYDVCEERGKLLEALEIRWMVHNCPCGEYDFCTNDWVDKCIIEWVANKISTFTFGFTPPGQEVLVKAHRKMFQSFLESIKSEET